MLAIDVDALAAAAAAAAAIASSRTKTNESRVPFCKMPRHQCVFSHAAIVVRDLNRFVKRLDDDGAVGFVIAVQQSAALQVERVKRSATTESCAGREGPVAS